MRRHHALLFRKLSQLSPPVGLLPVVWALLACRAGALIPRYAEPAADQPHAIVKLRTLYLKRPGHQLDELVTIGGDRIDVPQPTQSTRTSAIRVRPEFATFQVTSDFFDTETHVVRESYQQREEYYCGTQQAGFGAHTYQTAKYCSRYVTKYRDKWITERHPRGACQERVNLAPKPGEVYLLEYTFSAPGQCRLQCLRQTFTGPGQFHNEPCQPVLPPTEGS